MINEILEALRIREEKLQFLGREYLVRELGAGADLGDAIDPKALGAEEASRLVFWRMFVRCVLNVDGKRVFQDDDIPELRKGSRNKLAGMMLAVERVNGMSVEDNEKNSPAVQA